MGGGHGSASLGESDHSVDGNAETMPGMMVVGMSSTSRRGTWWRSGLGWTWRLGLLLPLLFAAAVLMFFFGVAGTRFGWFNAPAILAGGGGLLTWLMFRGRPGRRPAALVVGGIGAVVAAWLWAVTPPMPSKLASYLSSVDLPPGTELVEVMRYGNALCFDSCPSVGLRYHVPGTTDEVERALIDAFRSDGWSVERRPYNSGLQAVSEDTSKVASFIINPKYVVEGEPDPTPIAPPGYVVVDMSAGDNPCPPGQPGC